MAGLNRMTIGSAWIANCLALVCCGGEADNWAPEESEQQVVPFHVNEGEDSPTDSDHDNPIDNAEPDPVDDDEPIDNAEPDPVDDDEPIDKAETDPVDDDEPIDKAETDPKSFCGAVSVAVGMQHTCATSALGGLVCSGTINERVVTPPSGVFQTVSSGDWQSCGIDEAGNISCWGDNYAPSGPPPLFVPRSDPPTGTFRTVTAGGSLACGIRTDDTLACWGDELALEGMPDQGTFIAVDAGTMHACAIRSEGTLVCWGVESDGTTQPPEGTFQSISAGAYQTCAIRTDRSVACWGAQPHIPEIAPPAGPFAQVNVGGSPGGYDWYACALREDGSAECWSNETTESPSHSGPLDGRFLSLSTGAYQVCAIDPDCLVSCSPHTF